MAWTTPRTWVAGEVVTAALLNTHLRDNLNAIGATWTSYTPTWTATTTNPSLGNGTLEGRYLQVGKLVIGTVYLLMGSTTTYGAGIWRFDTPVTAGATPATAVGSTRLFDNSASNNQSGSAFLASATTMQALHATGSVTAAAPFTWATNDLLSISFTYEAA